VRLRFYICLQGKDGGFLRGKEAANEDSLPLKTYAPQGRTVGVVLIAPAPEGVGVGVGEGV